MMAMSLLNRKIDYALLILCYLHHKREGACAREIAGHFGFQSLATVHEHLTNLERKGYIRRTYNESRSIEVLPPKGTAGATDIEQFRSGLADLQAAIDDLRRRIDALEHRAS